MFQAVSNLESQVYILAAVFGSIFCLLVVVVVVVFMVVVVLVCLSYEGPTPLVSEAKQGH